MLTILSLAGLAIALILFLNLLSAGDTVRGVASSLKRKGESDGKESLPPRGDPSRIYRGESEGPRPRICPVCGTLLSKEDYLIAALEPETAGGGKRQAHIYGCPYCYTTGGVNLSKKGGMSLDRIEP